jgi:hypothetical protein
MSAFALRFVLCDGDDKRCDEQFTTGRGYDGIREARKAAREAGWSHPDGWTDYCPKHTKERRTR